MDIKASAKINLYLAVLGKRPDGYHNIKSIFLPVALHDRIVLENCPAGIETVAPDEIRLPGIPWSMSLCRPQDNLVARSAALLKEVTGYAGGVRIVLEKNIPIGAGLGGGSSDAAAVLKGLNALWKTSLSRERLQSLGARLGCDIPAFIHGGSLCMQGVGEHLSPIRCHASRRLCLLLVNPGFMVSTADIYARYEDRLTSAPAADMFQRVVSGLEQGEPKQVAAGLYNALRPAVFRKYPLLELIENKLVAGGALGVELTGSGSTLYALVRDAEHGRALAGHLRTAVECPLWTCVAQAI